VRRIEHAADRLFVKKLKSLDQVGGWACADGLDAIVNRRVPRTRIGLRFFVFFDLLMTRLRISLAAAQRHAAFIPTCPRIGPRRHKEVGSSRNVWPGKILGIRRASCRN
jgi:hypothetical protein